MDRWMLPNSLHNNNDIITCMNVFIYLLWSLATVLPWDIWFKSVTQSYVYKCTKRYGKKNIGSLE